MFEYLEPSQTGLLFSNILNPFDTTINIIQYLYAYNGAGVAIGDINNDGLSDIYFCANETSNKLFLNRGNMTFEDITEISGIGCVGDWSTGVAMVDINNDGLLDIYVCQVGGYKALQGSNKLFLNNGDLTFTEKASEYGLDHRGLSTQAAFFDYDMDGDLDMYLLCHSVHAPGNYSDTTLRSTADSISGDRIFENREGSFKDVTAETGIYSSKIGYGLGIGISDFNEDGFPDIYIANDFHENDYLYLNRGDATFMEVGSQAMACHSKFSMGMDISDLNNDGHAEIISLDMKPDSEILLKKSETPESGNIFNLKLKFGYHHQYARNMLQVFQAWRSESGIPQYAEMAQFSGIDATDWSWSALFADFDNDGYNDLYITNGIPFRPNDMDYLSFISNEFIQSNEPDSVLIANMPDGQSINFFYRNKGDLSFEDMSASWVSPLASYSNGAAYGDLDNDGDIDLVVNNLNANAFLLKNITDRNKSNHSLTVKLRGKESNPFAVGAKLNLYMGIQIQSREIFPSRGFMSSVDFPVHFGLGINATIDSLIVRWPSGERETFYQLDADKTHVLEYGSSTFANGHVHQNPPGVFTDITFSTGLEFRHVENAFNDEEREPMIPYLISREGPALAVGDVNGDQLDDVYLGGATGASGGLYLQQSNGRFKQSQPDFWNPIQNFEDVDAEFLDLENDGDLDLFVASGGNHLPVGSAYYSDRIYINDGTGNFSEYPAFFETQTLNSSCAARGDINGDGFTDLLVGSATIPGLYGVLPEAKIWLNNGDGRLLKMNLNPPIKGKIYDAQIVDLEGDGHAEIVVAGHWMPITIYRFEGGKLEKYEIPGTNGFWNSLKIVDLDLDGKLDIIAGNLGLNSLFKNPSEHPLKMYTQDFNRDGKIESVITYFRDGKEYPIHHKDQLFKQMISLKKDYIDYANFAESSIHDLFPKDILATSEQYFVSELRSCIFYQEGQSFKKIALPAEAQYAPLRAIEVLDVNSDSRPDILAFGNSDDYVPMIGRMSSGYGFLGMNNPGRIIESVGNQKSGLTIGEVCTAIAKVKTKEGAINFILGINGDFPKFITLDNPNKIN